MAGTFWPAGRGCLILLNDARIIPCSTVFVGLFLAPHQFADVDFPTNPDPTFFTAFLSQFAPSLSPVSFFASNWVLRVLL